MIADGFYEWKAIGKKTRIPYRIKLSNDGLFAFAGLWEEFDTEQGEMMHTFSIITTTANSTVSDIHERMPVILDQKSETEWLNNDLTMEDHMKILMPYNPDKMVAYTVSPQVNNAKNDHPALINFSAPADQKGNYTLFN